jgi:hypothetical protein
MQALDYSLFFKAQSAVCDEPEDKRMSPMAALRLWANYRDGRGEPGLVSLPITKEPRIKSRPRPARMTAFELAADLNRIVCGAIANNGHTEVLYVYVTYGSIAKTASFFRGFEMKMGNDKFFKLCRRIEGQAVDALVEAGYCYPVKRGKR